MHVGHRRVKHLMKSGGYVSDKSMEKEAKGFAKRVAEHEKGEITEEKHEGEKRGGRLDKRARGGAIKTYQFGGGIKPIRKITPSKHKPHVAVNITNINRGRGQPGLG